MTQREQAAATLRRMADEVRRVTGCAAVCARVPVAWMAEAARDAGIDDVTVGPELPLFTAEVWPGPSTPKSTGSASGPPA